MGPMRVTMLADKDKVRVYKDFMEWTGGHGADEVEPEKIDLYIEVAMPNDLNPDDVEAFLTECMNMPVLSHMN